MNPIKNILNKITGDAVEKVGNVIDSITTTDEEKLSKKAEISQIVLTPYRQARPYRLRSSKRK